MEPPPLVRRALAAADGPGGGCAPAEGALLHVLASARAVLRAGTADAGPVAIAWVASALPPGVPLVAAEGDAAAAGAAARLLADDPDARVLAGEWRRVLPAEAPFGLLVLGAGAAAEADAAAALLAPGAAAAALAGPPPGASLEAWLRHPALAAAELAVAGGRRVVVAARPIGG